MAKTLLQMAGADPAPAALSAGVLILIDMQNEYFDGPLALPGAAKAAEAAAGLLARARKLGTPVIHIRHRGREGGAFDPGAPRFQIHDSLAPAAGETVIDKGLPNAFAGTSLADELAAHPDKPLIVCGFMTHLCVSATVRSAIDHGRFSTVISDATATRDLPDATDPARIVTADAVHLATLSALADRFAVVAPASAIQD
ncbi:MAG: cysteine hydrolase [Rhodobacteraceae bacterium]|nr:cysteine hydrolase [Paracoccaceae bacterium]